MNWCASRSSDLCPRRGPERRLYENGIMDLLAFGRNAVEVNNESGPKFIRESIRRQNQNANSSADFVDPRKRTRTSAAAQHVD